MPHEFLKQNFIWHLESKAKVIDACPYNTIDLKLHREKNMEIFTYSPLRNLTCSTAFSACDLHLVPSINEVELKLLLFVLFFDGKSILHRSMLVIF